MSPLKITELLEVNAGNVITVNSDGSRNVKTNKYSRQRNIECVDRFSRLLQTIVDLILLNLTYILLCQFVIENTFWNWILVFQGYYLISEVLFNITIGKRLFKHVIVNDYGEPLNKSQLIIRNLSRLIPIDMFSILGSRAIHDIISKSYLLHQKELVELLELKKLNELELLKGNKRYELEKLNSKLALKRKTELIQELLETKERYGYPDLLVSDDHKLNIQSPVQTFKLKKFLPLKTMFFGPPTFSIVTSILICILLKHYSIEPNFLLIFIIGMILIFVVLLLIRPSIIVDSKGVKFHNGVKNEFEYKFENCLFIYFTTVVTTDQTFEAIGFLFSNNEEKNIPFNIGDDKRKIGEVIYYWMNKTNANKVYKQS